jgi:hypothetical protein
VPLRTAKSLARMLVHVWNPIPASAHHPTREHSVRHQSVLPVCMVTAQPPTFAPVKLVGRDPLAVSLSAKVAVITDRVLLQKHVRAKRAIKDPNAMSQSVSMDVVCTVPVRIPMYAAATMVGVGTCVM